jgi:hypothetical protein
MPTSIIAENKGGSKFPKEVIEAHELHKNDETRWDSLLPPERIALPLVRPGDLDETSVKSHRNAMVEARKQMLYQPKGGTFMDRSVTGAGKSYADGTMMKLLNSTPVQTLSLVPTHANCTEVVTDLNQRGVAAAAYPPLSEDTCMKWDEAKAVEAAGLSATAALCPDCIYRDDCTYREEMLEAMNAKHSVATQARGTVAMKQLARNRELICLHENPQALLRPTFVSAHGLYLVDTVAKQVGYRVSEKDKGFYTRLGQIALELDGWLHGTNENCLIDPMPEPAKHKPANLHAQIYDTLHELRWPPKMRPHPDAVRLALAATCGDLHYLAIVVDEKRTKKGKVEFTRKLIGGSKTILPRSASVLINDATGNQEELEATTGRKIDDITPPGRLKRLHAITQIQRDVTKNQKISPVADILRGILYDNGQYKKVGIITHQRFSRQLPKKLKDYATQIARWSYFFSGFSRGSNVWYGECDLLIVLGTPRVPAHAIRDHLLRIGKYEAAFRTKEETNWTDKHYGDSDWHAAYCSLVRSELMQCAGRGRGILPEGIPVIMVTTEVLGDLPDKHMDIPPLTLGQQRVMRGLLNDRGGRVQRNATEISRLIDYVSPRRVRQILAELERAGRVERDGTKYYLPRNENGRKRLIRPISDPFRLAYIPPSGHTHKPRNLGSRPPRKRESSLWDERLQ